MQGKNTLLAALLVGAYSLAGASHAEEVVGRSPDRIGGQLSGGTAAFLVGGGLGGPVGALVGGAIGAWMGGHTQESLGLAGERYQLRTEEGETYTLRSPQHQFELGDQVRVEGGRPLPLTAHHSAQTNF